MFKVKGLLLLEHARTLSSNESKSKLGEERKDRVGNATVHLELIPGAVRMSAKECSFDAIAELSDMLIATMQNFFYQFLAKFSENF